MRHHIIHRYHTSIFFEKEMYYYEIIESRTDLKFMSYFDPRPSTTNTFFLFISYIYRCHLHEYIYI